MRILLDECLPLRFRHHLVSHRVETVKYRGWKGIRNGSLLQLAADAGFDCMASTDLGMEHSHNVLTLPLTVYLLHAASNSIDNLLPLLPELLRELASPPARPTFVHIGLKP